MHRTFNQLRNLLVSHIGILSNSMSSFNSATRLRGFEAPTVWSEFTPLSQKHKSVNLGQGFPDWKTPDFVKKALIDAIHDDCNQYARSAGDVELLESLAEHYSPFVGRKIDAASEVTITVGASEALFAIMQAMLNEGDEVLMLEPSFDIYPAAVQMAGGVCSFVPILLDRDTQTWSVDMAELEAAITPKTKIMLINTPHNPTGKVFTLKELEQITEIIKRHPHVTAVTDEVYEKLVYDGGQHIRLASLPGMWERTLTVSSCGKTFSCTGWKVGWVYGAAHLVKPVMIANQWIQYCVSAPTQRAISKILRQANEPYEGFPSYYAYICEVYSKKRNALAEMMKTAHITPFVPQGGFFIMADTGNYEVPEQYINQPGPKGESPVSRDWGFARWMTVELGITPIPPSAFYTEDTKHHAANLARFAFCKTDESLVEAKERFLQMAALKKESSS